MFSRNPVKLMNIGEGLVSECYKTREIIFDNNPVRNAFYSEVSDFQIITRDSFVMLVPLYDSIRTMKYVIEIVRDSKMLKFTESDRKLADVFVKSFYHYSDYFTQEVIGVDVIAGMRGETDERFEESYRFIESLDISQLHAFTYSERPNTRALTIEPVVPVHVRHERCNRLIQLSEQKLHDFYARYVGSVRQVLFEQPVKGHPMHGFTDNYIRVEMPAVPEAVNTVRTVVLDESNEQGDALTARFVEESI